MKKRKLKTFAKNVFFSKPIQAALQPSFVFFEKTFNYPIERRRFRKKTGYQLELNPPRSFNHKIVYKKFFDRNSLLPVVADKLCVREFIREELGSEYAENILIPMLQVTDNPEHIVFANLPDKFIIKANHSSGHNILVKNKSEMDRTSVIKDCQLWLKESYGFFKHEWAYSQVNRKIIIEELLTEEGKVPTDYKFHMCAGECLFIQVDVDRFTSHARTLYDSKWNLIKATLKYPFGEEQEKPILLDKMKYIASQLSKKFDYIRVDLYQCDGKVYFGELTNYPGSGLEVFTPLDLDFALGDKWVVDRANYPHYVNT